MNNLIKSWGNTSSKEIYRVTNAKKHILIFGNNNSYGDASIPLSNETLIVSELKNDLFVNSNFEIEKYMIESQNQLFGIPGKQNVTLGGAVASDVHGKDGFWGGSFIKNVEGLLVKLPNNEIIDCTKERNSEIFFTTIGGYGLTGNILGIKFLETPLKFSNFFQSTTKKGSGLTELFKEFNLQEDEYGVAWIDLINKNLKWVLEISKPNQNNIGKSISHKEIKEISYSVPFIGRNFLSSMSTINNFYFKFNSNNKVLTKTRYKTLYPLGFLSNTKNIAKNRKIIQVQFSISDEYLHELENLIRSLVYKQVPLLCSIKRLSENPTIFNLSFTQKGWTVAVDFAYENFNQSSIRNFYKLLASCGGKIYLAKDSTLNEKEFKQFYPEHKEWSKIVKKIDPENLFQSEMSKRLGIKNW